MHVNDVRSTQMPLTQTNVIRKNADTAFKAEIDAATNARPKATVSTEVPAALTSKEKEFFEQLFPQSTDEVRKYNPYQRDGATVEIRLGTLLDRRG